MSIAGRRSIHKNTSQTNTRNTPAKHSSQEQLSEGTSSENDENDESLQSISDSELTNRRLKTQSPSPAGKRYYGVPEAHVVTKCVSRKDYIKIEHQTTRKRIIKRQDEGVGTYLWIFIIVAVAAVIIPTCLRAGTTEKTVRQCTFSNLLGKYKNEDKYLWTHLKTGIENILNDHSDKPAVYLLVHSGTKVAKELIKDIAKTTSTCFDSAMKPKEIETVDFASEEAVADYGHVIEKYKQKIQKGKVILIANLNEIPAEAARALHVICDTHSPIVPKVIIFLSLMAENKGERVVDTAQEALRKLWEPTISPNELDPIIARVTDEVILLKSQ